MIIEELVFGKKYDIYSMILSGKSPVVNFLESLDNTDSEQVMYLIEYTSNHGPPPNIQKFRHLRDGIYELKTRGGVRIFCFYGKFILPTSLILTHGMFKPKKTQLNREIEKVVKYRNDFLEHVDINIEDK